MQKEMIRKALCDPIYMREEDARGEIPQGDLVANITRYPEQTRVPHTNRQRYPEYPTHLLRHQVGLGT